MTQHSSIDVAMMVKAFASKADLARHLGVTRSAVSMAVKRAKEPTQRMEWAERHRRIKAGIEAGKTQGEIAAELGITKQAVSKIKVRYCIEAGTQPSREPAGRLRAGTLPLGTAHFRSFVAMLPDETINRLWDAKPEGMTLADYMASIVAEAAQ